MIDNIQYSLKPYIVKDSEVRNVTLGIWFFLCIDEGNYLTFITTILVICDWYLYYNRDVSKGGALGAVLPPLDPPSIVKDGSAPPPL